MPNADLGIVYTNLPRLKTFFIKGLDMFDIQNLQGLASSLVKSKRLEKLGLEMLKGINLNEAIDVIL